MQGTMVQVGIVLQDPTGRIIVASEHASRLLGMDGHSTLTGRMSLFEDGMAIHRDGSEFPSASQPAACALRTGQPQRDVVLGLRRAGAETLWFHVRAEPLMQVGSSVPYMTVSRFVPIADGVPLSARGAPAAGSRRRPVTRVTCRRLRG
jgi:hypothetical protein